MPRPRCPHCDSTKGSYTMSKVSGAGWIVFVLMLVICFPLCIFGLFIKDEWRVCKSCRMKIV